MWRKVNISRWIFLCAGVFITLCANAQYNGFVPVSDVPSFRKKFAEESTKVLTITSNFRQEKILTALTEKITSQGKFWFKRSDKVRIEYRTPYEYLMVMNGDKMTIRDGGKESQVNVRSNKLFQQVNRIMIDCVQGTIMESKDFTVRAFENKDTYLLEMTPSSKALKDFFKTIVLRVEKKDYSVDSIEMNEPGGDQTIIIFTDKKLNASVTDEVFTL